MKQLSKITEKGQSLVMVVVLMLALIGMLAYVLDGGYAYAQRRLAQTAADAGALAGADTLCKTGDQNAAIATATEYAINRNRAVNIQVSFPAADVIQVIAEIPYSTIIAGMFGQSEITAAGIAEAGCSPICSGVGILPIAWNCSDPNLPDPGFPPSSSSDCEIRYGPGNTYIIMDSEDLEESTKCSPEGTVDCDMNDDGINDIEMLSGGDRSWLSLDGSGGASDLIGWICNGFGGEISTHTWLPGVEGVSTSQFKAVTDCQLGNEVLIPVYDAICEGYPSTHCPGAYHTNPPSPWDDQIVGVGATWNTYYHIVSFALFVPTCVRDPNGNCPAFEALLPYLPPGSSSIKSIEGYFVTGYSSGDPCPPGGGYDTGLYTITLLR